ncbi:hypothetical protein GCM10027258_93450 [Amycolatopsis stemonae]
MTPIENQPARGQRRVGDGAAAAPVQDDWHLGSRARRPGATGPTATALPAREPQLPRTAGPALAEATADTAPLFMPAAPQHRGTIPEQQTWQASRTAQPQRGPETVRRTAAPGSPPAPSETVKYPGSIFRYQVTAYQGSDRLADLALAALYSQDMHRPLVHDRDAVAYVLGCMLLVELHSARQIRIGPDGRIYPGRPAADVDDSAHADILEYLHAVKRVEPVASWLDYLVIEQRSTTSVWKRLVQAGAAKAERRWRRRVRYEVGDFRVTGWARRYLEVHGTARDVPEEAVVLWRALRELGLNARALDLQPDIGSRLEHAKFPAELTPLFDALTSALARVATPL